MRGRGLPVVEVDGRARLLDLMRLIRGSEGWYRRRGLRRLRSGGLLRLLLLL